MDFQRGVLGYLCQTNRTIKQDFQTEEEDPETQETTHWDLDSNNREPYRMLKFWRHILWDEEFVHADPQTLDYARAREFELVEKVWKKIPDIYVLMWSPLF